MKKVKMIISTGMANSEVSEVVTVVIVAVLRGFGVI